MAKFQTGPDPRRNGAGRPRGRIAKLREALGEITRDGREIAEGIAAIWRDPEADTRDRLAAYELALSYLVGKPEQAVSVEADMTVTGHAQIDMRAVLAKLPSELVDQVVASLDRSGTPMLAPGDDESEVG